MEEGEPEQKKKETKPRIIISELDQTMIKLHELFQNKDLVVSINLKTDEEEGELKRTFQLVDCFCLVDGSQPYTKRPDYFGWMAQTTLATDSETLSFVHLYAKKKNIPQKDFLKHILKENKEFMQFVYGWKKIKP